MATPLHSSDWLTNKNTLVQLVPKNEEAQAILRNSNACVTLEKCLNNSNNLSLMK